MTTRPPCNLRQLLAAGSYAFRTKSARGSLVQGTDNCACVFVSPSQEWPTAERGPPEHVERTGDPSTDPRRLTAYRAQTKMTADDAC